MSFLLCLLLLLYPRIASRLGTTSKKEDLSPCEEFAELLNKAQYCTSESYWKLLCKQGGSHLTAPSNGSCIWPFSPASIKSDTDIFYWSKTMGLGFWKNFSSNCMIFIISFFPLSFTHNIQTSTVFLTSHVGLQIKANKKLKLLQTYWMQ